MKESSGKKKIRKAAKRREITVICVLVMVLVVAIGLLTLSLKNDLAKKQEEIADIDEQIAQEQARAKDLEDEELLMQSNEFFEKIARERLGLVYSDETIIKPTE